MVLLLATGFVLQLSLGAAWLAVLWSGVAGFVTGAAFPILLAVVARIRSGNEGMAAGLIEAADHLGAAVGAILTGLVWFPVLGLYRTCLLFALLKTVSIGGAVFLHTPKKEVKQVH